MKVKDFSKKIELAAVENAKGRTVGKKLTNIVLGAATILSFETTRGFFLNPIYHASGAVCYAASRAADKYISYKVCRLFEDPRYREYGLEGMYVEANPNLPKTPKRKDVLFNRKATAIEIAGGILSAAVPPFGYGITAPTPLIYENNWAIKNRIKKALEIGDEVKSMIETGTDKKEVNRYLNALIKSDKRK